MKVLHINSYFNSSKFYKNLYDLQVENGLDIKVYVPVQNSKQLDSKKNWGEYTSVRKIYNKVDRLFFSLKRKKIYKDIVNVINIEEYSIIHAHSLFSNGFVALKLKRKFKIPYIVAVRNTDVNLFFRKMPFLRKKGLEILKHANRILFISESYKSFLVENYIPKNLQSEIEKKTYVIPNGINKFWFDNIGKEKSLDLKNEIKLLQVGDINKNKNITMTIEAVKILNQRGYNITLFIVGEIKDSKLYKSIVKSPYLKYIPPQSKELLLKIYRESDIFVMPSLTETFGLVYAEAMSQGLPVIYTKGQGFDNQFKNGEVGYAVLPKSEVNIADKIERIIFNYDEVSKRCLNSVNKFNWDSIEKQYKDIYINIIKES